MGAEFEAGDAKGEQPAKNPRRDARRIKFRFMQYKMSLRAALFAAKQSPTMLIDSNCEGDCFLPLGLATLAPGASAGVKGYFLQSVNPAILFCEIAEVWLVRDL